MDIASKTSLQHAADYLAAHDSILAPVIDATGPCTIRPHREYYRALADSIIGQQLSVKAAAAIKQRVRNLWDGTFPTPDMILARSPEMLQQAGLSRAKVAYIRDLARHIEAGTVAFDTFDHTADSDIIAMLMNVKGIGEWTAHMFLIFCMGRLDVLPRGDLGIRTGIRRLYTPDTLPTPAQVTELAECRGWHPYASVASWYIWRSLDNEPAI